jgi:hypothetical protein
MPPSTKDPRLNDPKYRVRRLYGDAVADAHDHCSRHRAELDASDLCGCFHCRRTFGREQIEEGTDDDDTALCPLCGIDAVLGSASGYEISAQFLTEMHAAWFGTWW